MNICKPMDDKLSAVRVVTGIFFISEGSPIMCKFQGHTFIYSINHTFIYSINLGAKIGWKWEKDNWQAFGFYSVHKVLIILILVMIN